MKTQKRFAFLVITSFLLIALLSCEADSYLFSASDRNSMYSVSLKKKGLDLSDGTFLKQGDSLELSVKALAASEESLSSIELTFEDPHKSNVSEATDTLVIKTDMNTASYTNSKNIQLVSALINPVFKVQVPASLHDGYHLLNVGLVSKEALVYEKKIPVFIISDLYAIRSVQMYPEKVAPGSMALISVQVLNPENTNPVIGVLQGKNLVSSGSVKDGRYQFFWRAPEKEGFYPLKINLYPDIVNASAMASFNSPENQILQATVGTVQKTSVDPFENPGNFFSLFTLQGSFEDSGYAGANDARALEITGTEDVRIAGSGYGYALGNGNSLTEARFMIPNANAALMPFSLLLKMTPLALADGSFKSGAVFETQNANGFNVSVFINEESFMALKIKFPDGTSIDQVSSIEMDSNQHTYVLSFIPQADKLLLQWACDDSVYPPTVHALPKFSVLNSGNTTIGSQKLLSFEAIYDDVGIYAEASDDSTRAFTSSFSVFSKIKYSSRLIFAEGFDSLAVDSLYSKSGVLELGRLNLRVKESLTLDTFTLPANGLTLDLKGSLDLNFKTQDGKTIFTVNRNGSIYDAQKNMVGSILFPKDAIKFSLTLKDGKLYAVSGDKKIVCASLASDSLKITLTLENLVASDPKIQGFIDSLLIYENEALDAALLSKSIKPSLALIK